jgi:DNA polymerase-1
MTLSDVNLHLIETFEDAENLLTWLSNVKGDRVAFDTEGSGLSPETDFVRMFQIGDEHDGFAIPFMEWKGLVRDIIRRWRGRWVGWNSKYDCAMLAAEGIEMPTHMVDDGRFAAHIADPTKSVALKTQSGMHVDARAAAMQGQLSAVMQSGGWTWGTVPIVPTGPVSAFWTYAALDPVLTLRTWNHHAKTVLVDSPRAYDLELSIGWIVNSMERNGVLVDREYTMRQEKEFTALYHSLSERARSEFGVDAGSKDQIVDVLLKDNVPLTKRTPGGDFSLDKEVMATLDHPLVHLISERRKVEKLRSTYLSRFLEYSERDNRIHPRINSIGGSGKTAGESGGQFGVRTGRMSLESPNLQQLPRGGDPLSSVIRNCIVAGEGKTLLMCDYDQIELRLMAHLSRDKGLADAFAAGGDFFTTLTRGIYHDPSIDKKDRRRQLTKSYVYATLYGAGNDKLATTTGVPLAEVEQLSRDFASSYSGVPAFQQAVQRKARERGQSEGVYYTRSPLTNRKFIGEQGKEYKLVNFTIQGMAAELLKTKLLELDAAGLGDAMRLPVHDEVIIEVDDADVPDAVATLRDVMNDDQLLSVPITAGVSHGKRWGMKEDYDG